jgi:hypothetical protein
MSILTALLKYVPAILSLKQVAEVYKEDVGEEKPLWLSRRVVGAVITLISAVVLAVYGVDISGDAAALTDAVVAVGSGASAVYGIVMTIVGYVKREK